MFRLTNHNFKSERRNLAVPRKGHSILTANKHLCTKAISTMETFDLLPYREKNDIFRVSFDFYTPRPQFVIIPKDIESIDPEFTCMSAEQTCILIEATKSIMSCYHIPQGILSIHRGSWKSRPAKSFHCHLCVDSEQYLKIFERKKKAIPNWPSVSYVTRQWGWNKDPRSYAQNVRGYPYKSRFKEDVSGILEIIQASFDQEACSQTKDTSINSADSSPQVLLGHSLKDIVYHPKHPKIGFVGKKNASVYDLHEMLWTMENYAREHSLTDTETDDKNFGCHVCLYFGPGKYLYLILISRMNIISYDQLESLAFTYSFLMVIFESIFIYGT